jgi:hypothetical protein
MRSHTRMRASSDWSSSALKMGFWSFHERSSSNCIGAARISAAVARKATIRTERLSSSRHEVSTGSRAGVTLDHPVADPPLSNCKYIYFFQK